jgi:hypothetical protein
MFLKGLPHGMDVLRRHIGLDVVNGCEDEASTRREVVDAALHLFLHLGDGAAGKNPLGVDPAAPEAELRSEFPLELLGIHVGGADLDGVEGVDSRLDQVGDQGAHAAAGVQQELDVGLCALLDVSEELGMARLEKPAVHVGRHHRSRLTAEVVAVETDVDLVPQDLEGVGPHPHLELRDSIEQILHRARVGCHVHQGVFDPVDHQRHVEDPETVEAEHHRAPRATEPLDLLANPDVSALLIGVRPRMPGESLGRERALQRGADGVHVQAGRRLRPLDAPLIVIDQRVPVLEPDHWLGLGRELDESAAHVHLQVPQDILGDLREAAGGDEEIVERVVRLLGQAEKVDQPAIGLRGHSRLDRAAQIEGNPVGLTAAERLEHPLS